MHETVKLYRQAEHCLREFRLNDPWYIKPPERDGRGWGATEAIRGALCHWIEVKDGKIKNYQIIAPTTWNVGPRDADGNRGPIEEALIGAPIADPRDPVEVGHVAARTTHASSAPCTPMMPRPGRNWLGSVSASSPNRTPSLAEAAGEGCLS